MIQNKYVTIWKQMLPEKWYTAAELDVASASLIAMVARNMVEAQPTSPKRYRKLVTAATALLCFLDEHRNEIDTYFDVYCRNSRLGMLCSMKNGVVLDCWEKPYDISTAYRVRIKKNYYLLES